MFYSCAVCIPCSAIQPIACQLARSPLLPTPLCIKVNHCHLYISGMAWQKFKCRCPCASMRQEQTGDLFIKEMLYRYKTPLKGCFVYKMNARFYLNLSTFFLALTRRGRWGSSSSSNRANSCRNRSITTISMFLPSQKWRWNEPACPDASKGQRRCLLFAVSWLPKKKKKKCWECCE